MHHMYDKCLITEGPKRPYAPQWCENANAWWSATKVRWATSTTTAQWSSTFTTSNVISFIIQMN